MINITNYIYVREHESWVKYHVCKVGKTTNIVNREDTYITGEFIPGEFTLILLIIDYNLDKLDNEIKKEFEEYNKYCGGGIEFYNIEIKDKLEEYLKKCKIEYRILTDKDINELKRKEPKIKSEYQIREY